MKFLSLLRHFGIDTSEPASDKSLKPPTARAWLPVRLLLSVGASIGVAMLLVLMLYITDLGLSVWERMQRGEPPQDFAVSVVD